MRRGGGYDGTEPQGKAASMLDKGPVIGYEEGGGLRRDGTPG